MSTTTNHFKLGLFTLGGFAILIAAILAFGARSYFEPTIFVRDVYCRGRHRVVGRLGR